MLTPHPPSPPGEWGGGGRRHTRRAERGSIFWKTRDIGLPSNNLYGFWHNQSLLVWKERISHSPMALNDLNLVLARIIVVQMKRDQ
jgi:hypothetical protein